MQQCHAVMCVAPASLPTAFSSHAPRVQTRHAELDTIGAHAIFTWTGGAYRARANPLTLFTLPRGVRTTWMLAAGCASKAFLNLARRVCRVRRACAQQGNTARPARPPQIPHAQPAQRPNQQTLTGPLAAFRFRLTIASGHVISVTISTRMLASAWLLLNLPLLWKIILRAI